MTRKTPLFFLSVLILLPTLINLPLPVGGTPTPLLYVNPPTTSDLSPGTTFDIQIKVAYFPSFNGWDIHVRVDSSILNPVTLSITGNVISANVTSRPLTELANCVNGQGLGCDDSNEGPGIVRSVASNLGSETAMGGGLLFTITYKVVGTGFSNVAIFADKITNGTPYSVAHITQPGTYGTQTIQPDFKIGANPTDLVVTLGLSQNATISLNSLDSFVGVVSLTAQVSIPGLGPVTSPTVSLYPDHVILQGNGQNSSTIKISSSSSDSVTGYLVNVTASSGTIAHWQSITVTVNRVGDFLVDISPRQLKVHATNSGSSIITLDTHTGFSGGIRLKMDVPPVHGLVASLGAYNFTISPGNPVSTVFAIRTPPSDRPFVYRINITASSQSSTHLPLEITVISPSPDFTFQIGGSGTVVQAGQALVFTLNMTSVDYFKGTLFLLATSLSHVKEAFTRSRVALDLGNSSTSLITISTDAYLALGNHDINATALGTVFPSGASLNHNLIITITVVRAPVVNTILGLQPLTYFGIVGALWVGVIGAVIREITRPRPKRFLS